MKLIETLTQIPADCALDVHPSVTVDKSEIIFKARNCSLEIAEGCHFRALHLYFLSDNTHVKIGRGTQCPISFWANLSGDGRSITVGEHCLLENVKLRTSDNHHIIDRESGEMINPAADIMIGDHVWIAEDVLVLKGSNIGSGSVVGAKSLVNNTLPENCLVAGTPAKVLRRDIDWRYSAANITPVEQPFPIAPETAAAPQHLQKAQKMQPSSAPRKETKTIPFSVGVYWQKLRRHLAPELVERGDHLAAAHWPHEDGPDVRQKVRFMTDLLSGKSEIALKGGRFRFGQLYDLTVQLEEILCNVQYNFETDSKAPFIIDAGGCYGVASYLFNRRHPTAEILTFEPNPANAAILRENIDRIGMNTVTLCEAAVGVQEDVVEFYAASSMPMGSSLLPRLDPQNHEIQSVMVQQVNLADRIANRTVDFLKLDVEGVEYKIIEALDGRMDNIRNMFIELHFGPGLPKSNLTHLLAILDRNGFDHMITRAGNASPPHPLKASGTVWRGSLNLWARRA